MTHKYDGQLASNMSTVQPLPDGYRFSDPFAYDYYGNHSGNLPPYFDQAEILEVLKSQKNNNFDRTTEAIITTVFSIMIIFGALGNGLVCYVVFLNSHMRTPRNIFIINLAISDLTLCLFTQPLNLYRLLNSQWHLGAFMCKLSAMLQGTNVFVSTISITAIALDRFQVIVYPTRDSMKRIGGAAALIVIWIISLLMSSPLIIFSVYNEEQPVPNIDYYHCYCLEDLTLRAEKGAYSVASMVVQYILPVITVTIAHARICNKLKYRMVNRRPPRSSGDVNSPPPACNRNRRNENRSARKRKTNILLAMIGVVFVLSWLPLNISNILVEFQFQIFFKNKSIDINLLYIVCHTLVLSSACSNPVLYGWLNDNFRKEFMKVLHCDCCNVVKPQWLFLRRAREQGLPVITFSPEENGGNTNGFQRAIRRPTNTSHMFMTTEIDQTCPQSAVSL
ncbi:neuropeptide F receptor-like [Mercenaria mercenaria]|uniref:neuropeptide F receptor-like n=1 Tax=Mercenaria mercenaria TaxID=6596 RepID=UPI00234F84A9|nr:neuropeptide F receptor-like [Mercenaria mercenaria]